MGSDRERSEPEGYGGAEPPEDGEATIAEVEGISLSPSEHQRIMDLVHGEPLEGFRGHERRYLIVGAGGDAEAARRRDLVYEILDDWEPSATATRLEDLGLTRDELELWARVFDILCGMATHVVGVLEDFDGGYVWELGLMFSSDYREKAWVLKRRYPDEGTERAKYANGMAISHVRLLLTGDRCYEWTDVDELRAAAGEIP